MDDIKFLTMEEVLFLHLRSVQQYGGDSTLLDRNKLDSALAMPRQAFGGTYMHDGFGAMAAAYLFHICMNHPFADGNKRTSAGAAIAFLKRNAVPYTIATGELAEITLAVANGSMGKAELTALFEQKLT